MSVLKSLFVLYVAEKWTLQTSNEKKLRLRDIELRISFKEICEVMYKLSNEEILKSERRAILRTENKLWQKVTEWIEKVTVFMKVKTFITIAPVWRPAYSLHILRKYD